METTISLDLQELDECIYCSDGFITVELPDSEVIGIAVSVQLVDQVWEGAIEIEEGERYNCVRGNGNLRWIYITQERGTEIRLSWDVD